MNKIRKGDEVIVLAGKDKGKKTKVLSVNPGKGKVVLEKVNIVKKHSKAGQNSPGGIIEMEKPIDSSNVMLVCNYCKKPSKVVIESVDGKNVRKCKSCNEVLDKK